MRPALLLAAVAACSAGAPGPGLDVDRALGHTAALVELGPRPADSAGAARAVEYLVRALGPGLERLPVGAVELPAIRVLGEQFRAARTAHTRDPNLAIRFGPATGAALLVMAHYDSVPGSPGAVDNAAGVGVLIELARTLQASPPPAPVIVMFTADEERGLVGAEAYAARAGTAIGFAVALDLTGASGELSLNGASTLIRGGELRWLAAAAARAGVVLRAPLVHRVVSRWWPQAERSDHGPFTRRGIRAVHLYHRGQDGEWIDLAYHTARDTLDRVDRASVDELGRLLRALVAEPPPAAGSGDPGFWLPVAVDTVVPRWLLLALELVLGGAALAALLGLVRARPARTRGLGVLAGAGCTLVAAACAHGIERLAAGDHPAPWLHAPRAPVIAMALVLAGGVVLATRVAGRLAPWIGAGRYLAVAIAVDLITGASLAFAGAAELAWAWLAPAAALGLAARVPRHPAAAVLALAAALLPAALVLDPDRLREAAWNGFLPGAIPLVVWVGLLLIPAIATGAWLIRTRSPFGALSTMVLTLGSGLAMILGSVMLVRDAPPCTAMQFQAFHVGCESRTRVR